MDYPRRKHRIDTCESPGEVAGRMFSRIWPLCQGFQWDSLTLLNDSADLEWEETKYGVIQHGRQIEELTVHLMTPQSFHDELVDLNREGSPAYLGPVVEFGGHPKEDCPLCLPGIQ